MKVVVSNSSPICYLVLINQIHLILIILMMTTIKNDISYEK
jgi:hypothetical protein